MPSTMSRISVAVMGLSTAHMRLSHRVGQHLRGAGVVFKEEQRVIIVRHSRIETVTANTL